MTAHVWCDPDWRVNAACWCGPFVDRPELPLHLAPLVFHRPHPGWVFHYHGEQGPPQLLQAQIEEAERASEDRWTRILVARMSRSHA